MIFQQIFPHSSSSFHHFNQTYHRNLATINVTMVIISSKFVKTMVTMVTNIYGPFIDGLPIKNI